MKKTVSMILCIMMLLSCLFTSGCGLQATEVADIGGKTPKEAYELAIQSLEDIDMYYVELSLYMEAKLWIIPLYSLDLSPFYYYTYDGDNEHHGIVDGVREKLEEEDMLDIIDGFDDEIWYVDNVCYVREGTDKYKFQSSYSPIQRSDYELAISDLLRFDTGSCKCYKQGDRYYFETTLEGYDVMIDDTAEKEVYTVYFNADGLVEEINVKTMTGGIIVCTITAKYYYDNTPAVTAPENANSFSNY